MSWTSRLTIKHKVIGSLSIVLLAISLVVVTAMFGLSGIRGSTNEVVSETQPAVLASMELMQHLDKAVGALGFYLLSKESQRFSEYQDQLDETQAKLAELRKMQVIADDHSLQSLLNGIQSDIERFAGYKDRMHLLATTDAENFPALKFSSQNLNPLSQEVLQNFSQMLLSEAEEPATPERKHLLTDINELRYAWSNTINGVRAYLAYRAQPSLDEVNLYATQTRKLIEKIKGYGGLLTLDQEDSLNQASALSNQFIENFKTLEQIHGSEKWRTDAYLVQSEISPLLTGVQAKIRYLIQNLRKAIDDTNQNLVSQVKNTQIKIIALFLGAFVVAVLVIVWLSLRVVKPISNLRDILHNIADGEGDLTQRVPVKGNDELGQASAHFNNFVANLQNLIRQIAQHAQKVAGVADSASGKLNIVTTNIQSAAERSKQTADETEQAHQHVQRGVSVIQQMSSQSTAVENEILKLKDDIHGVYTTGQEMLAMVDSIVEITSQTNLLALNAAIEAARAGEAGRGFAVVADEVRQLSLRTDEVTKQIAEKLQANMQSNTHLGDVMQKVATTSQDMLSSVEEANRTIEEINANVTHVHLMINEIANSAQQQSASITNTANHVEQISGMEQDNSKQTSEAHHDMSQLAVLSQQLNQLVSRFKI